MRDPRLRQSGDLGERGEFRGALAQAPGGDQSLGEFLFQVEIAGFFAQGLAQHALGVFVTADITQIFRQIGGKYHVLGVGGVKLCPMGGCGFVVLLALGDRRRCLKENAGVFDLGERAVLILVGLLAAGQHREGAVPGKERAVHRTAPPGGGEQEDGEGRAAKGQAWHCDGLIHECVAYRLAPDFCANSDPSVSPGS